MIIKFSMDGIKNMNLLYIWTTCKDEGPFGVECTEEHYHGTDYCKEIIDGLNNSTWKEKIYQGQRERIANETFKLIATDDSVYEVAFAIDTYRKEATRLEVTILSPETAEYDHQLEDLKIAFKDALISDWQKCTWLVDEQAAALCSEAFEQAFIIENNLRAFASKVLIHFLGVNWISSFGLEMDAASINPLRGKFLKRVPEFDKINTDFLSMTLEKLKKIMIDGVVYKDDPISIEKPEFLEIQKRAIANKSANSVVDYLKPKLTVDKRIWDDLFVAFIDEPDAFKSSLETFIEDRNHVAHSKVLSWSAYQVILKDFNVMDSLIQKASEKYNQEETSEELLATWEAEREEEYDPDYEKDYYRSRLAGETGMDILDEDGISDWFDDVLHDLYSDIYQRYHLDICYELSDFNTPSEDEVVLRISCPVDEEVFITIIAEYSIDDDLGEDSTCYIIALDGKDGEICKAEIHFHNGNGVEGENGLMEADDNTEYDDTEIEYFKEELFAAIASMNIYPNMADAIAYRSKGSEQVVADFPCEQCGKMGVSLTEELLPIGKCCFCGWENELVRCERCGELVSVDSIDHGFCPSCLAYIDRQ